jgi:hypothetical protein
MGADIVFERRIDTRKNSHGGTTEFQHE